MRQLGLALLLLAAITAPSQSEPSAKILSLPGVRASLAISTPFLARRRVRVLVPYSKTYFFLDKGEPYGLAAEYGRELEKWLNQRHGKKPYFIEVAFVPTRRDRLFQDLRDGKGDIAAGNLTITPERAALVDFIKPWGTGVKEVLVTGPSAPTVEALAELGGRELTVRKSSSYYGHLLELNKKLEAEGHKPIKLVAADENLEDEDLMEMIGSGMMPWTIVDLHKAKLWARIYPKLTVHDKLAVHEGGEIAWAIRKNTPQLRKELDQFVASHDMASDFGDGLRSQYLHDGKVVKNAMAPESSAKLKELLVFFRQYGSRYSVDPYMLAAQGFQESAFDQSLKMKSGAVGVMQMMPSTAREELGINDIVTRAEDNIHSAAAYLRFIADKFLNDPAISDNDRVLMALASYNAGPGALQRARAAAKKSGYDPNIWFDNVEHGVAQVAGQEAVQYVGHIYKYYLIYSSVLAKQ